MGGRGRGGISKIPASLQAKMDAVCFLPFFWFLKLNDRWHNDHRTRVYLHLDPNKLLALPTPTRLPWLPFSGPKLYDSSLAQHHLEEVVPTTHPVEPRAHQAVAQVLDHNFPVLPLAH